MVGKASEIKYLDLSICHVRQNLVQYLFTIIEKEALKANTVRRGSGRGHTKGFHLAHVLHSSCPVESFILTFTHSVPTVCLEVGLGDTQRG